MVNKNKVTIVAIVALFMALCFSACSGTAPGSSNQVASYEAYGTYNELPDKTKDPFLCDYVASDGENAYYVDKAGRVVQMPLSKLTGDAAASISDATDFYRLPISSYTESYVPPIFFELCGHKYFLCDTGGVMGSSCTVELTKSGFKEVTTSRMAHFDFGGENVFEFYAGAAPAANNLYKIGHENIGEPNFLYGWNWSEDGDGSGGGAQDYIFGKAPAQNLYYDGENYLYVLAFDQTETKGERPTVGDFLKNGIYCVDLRNNETTRISPKGARTESFMVDDATLFFAADDKYYSYFTPAGWLSEIPTPEEPLDAYAVLGGRLYGVTGYEQGWEVSTAILNLVEDGELFPIEETYRWREMDIKKDQIREEKFLIIACDDSEDTPYTLVVIDECNNIVLKNSDVADPKSTTVKNRILYYYDKKTERICSVAL